MGLAEPRKRLKISHDPNNLAWSQSTESYGQKLLASQGWKPGEGLGARSSKHLNSSTIPKHAVSYKDDALGLGASLKSQDPVHTRTGLDAFQGLLGRLNGKSDADVEEELRKNEDRKLAMWAQGRWGGVMFVPGGTLVQGDGYKNIEKEAPQNLKPQETSGSQSDMAEMNDSAERKAEKKKRKEEKRRTSKAAPDAPATVVASAMSIPGVTQAQIRVGSPGSDRAREKTSAKEKKKKKRERPTAAIDDNGRAARAEKEGGDSAVAAPPEIPSPSPNITKTNTSIPRTGRHVIRGRNIEAKKMAFSDTKMLDQIFMVKG